MDNIPLHGKAMAKGTIEGGDHWNVLSIGPDYWKEMTRAVSGLSILCGRPSGQGAGRVGGRPLHGQHHHCILVGPRPAPWREAALAQTGALGGSHARAPVDSRARRSERRSGLRSRRQLVGHLSHADRTVWTAFDEGARRSQSPASTCGSVRQPRCAGPSPPGITTTTRSAVCAGVTFDIATAARNSTITRPIPWSM